MKGYNILKISFLITTIVVGLMFCGCTKKKQENVDKIVPVKVMKVAAIQTANTRNYVGIVEESASILLSFSQMGTVEEVFVKEGQKVESGQLLAKLNSATAQDALNGAMAQLNRAQDAYDRLVKLHDNGSLSEIKFVEVKTSLQQAKSQVSIARKSLNDCKLHAPCAGVIASRQIETGMNMMPNMQAFKLVTIDKVFVKISVSENEIANIKEGQQVKIEMAVLDSAVFAGTIEMKGITANAVTHTYEVKIGVDNTQELLMPGMACKATISPDSSEEKQNKIVVPNQSIQTSPDGKRFVWLAVDGKAIRRFVEIGALSNSGVIVEKGLAIGELLIVEGHAKVSEGMKINIKQ